MKDFNEIKASIITAQENSTIFCEDCFDALPSRDDAIKLSNAIRSILIPGLYRQDMSYDEIFYYSEKIIKKAYINKDVDVHDINLKFFEKMPRIISQLNKDLEMFAQSDPAVKFKEEIVLAYPGFYAILIYRIAHILYELDVPYLPRLMSEVAHSATGIDINPGANIDEGFFIDHGTGIVIGETVTIGKNVKIYQGVTLGALSTKNAPSLANVKRHPTIKDNVVIYSNASILGGDVVIGENSIIGGNTFITKSVPSNSLVKIKLCGLDIVDMQSKE